LSRPIKPFGFTGTTGAKPYGFCSCKGRTLFQVLDPFILLCIWAFGKQKGPL